MKGYNLFSDAPTTSSSATASTDSSRDSVSLYDVVQSTIEVLSRLADKAQPNVYNTINERLEAFATRLYIQDNCVKEIRSLCDEVLASHHRQNSFNQAMGELQHRCDIEIELKKERDIQISHELSANSIGFRGRKR